MTISKNRIFGIFLVAITVSGFAVPHATEAKKLDLYNPKKKYADEKIDIKNPTSKCVTERSKKSHLANLERAEKEGVQFGVSSTTKGDMADAYRTYLEGLDIIWEAMEEPYCGFGAFGVKAAYHSYDKSIIRLHDRFFVALKKLKKTSP